MNTRDSSQAGPGSGQGHTARLSNKELLLQNKDLAADVFLIYVLTLSVFPGFLSEDTGSHGLGSWYVLYCIVYTIPCKAPTRAPTVVFAVPRYVLVLIATYNTGDLVGRCLPLARRLRLACRARITAAAAARFLLVPAFYLAGRWGGGQGYTILLTAVLGLSNGYLTVCVLTEAPRGYEASLGAGASWGWHASFGSAVPLFRALTVFSALPFAGPRAERAGERARRLPPRRHFHRLRARLAVAHRQGLVKRSRLLPTCAVVDL